MKVDKGHKSLRIGCDGHAQVMAGSSGQQLAGRCCSPTCRAHSAGAGILLMVQVEDENDFQRFLQHRVDLHDHPSAKVSRNLIMC